jgi:hypothetical protein
LHLFFIVFSPDDDLFCYEFSVLDFLYFFSFKNSSPVNPLLFSASNSSSGSSIVNLLYNLLIISSFFSSSFFLSFLTFFLFFFFLPSKSSSELKKSESLLFLFLFDFYFTNSRMISSLSTFSISSYCILVLFFFYLFSY